MRKRSIYSIFDKIIFKAGWWYVPVFPALTGQRQEDPESEDSLGYSKALPQNKQKYMNVTLSTINEDDLLKSKIMSEARSS